MATEKMDLASMAREHLRKAAATAAKAPEAPPEDEQVVDDPHQGEPEEAQEAPESEQPEEPKSTRLRDYLRSNLKVAISDDVDDDQLMPQVGKVLEEHHQLKEEMEELRRQSQEREKSLKEYEEWKKAQAVKPPETKPEPKETEKPKRWQRLEYDPEWQMFAEFDKDSGQWVGRDKYGSFGTEAAQKLNSYDKERATRAQRLTSDTLSALREAGLDEFLEEYNAKQREALVKEVIEQAKREATSEWEKKYSETRVQDDIREYFSTHVQDFFQLDANGQPMLNMTKDAHLLTPKGEAYQKAYNRIRESGVSDAQKLHELALEYADLATASASPPAEPKKSAKERNKERKQQFLNRPRSPAKHDTDRDGTVNTAKQLGEPQQKLSFRDMVLRDPDNAEHLGSLFQG